MRPTDAHTRRILLPATAKLGRARAYRSEAEELTVVPRSSYPNRWANVSSVGSFHLATPRSTESNHGVWTTVSFHQGVPLRLHAVFHESVTAHLSTKPFVSDSEHPAENEVRITTLCSTEQCPYCASVETALSGRVAMLQGTLELLQIPIRSACDFVVHVYAPQTIHLDYAIVSETSLFEHPVWSHISCVERGVWSAAIGAPPPPPALIAPAPSPDGSGDSSTRWVVWTVSVSALVLSACFLLLVHTRCSVYQLNDSP